MTYPLLEIQVCSGRAETIFLSASGTNFGAECRMCMLGTAAGEGLKWPQCIHPASRQELKQEQLWRAWRPAGKFCFSTNLQANRQPSRWRGSSPGKTSRDGCLPVAEVENTKKSVGLRISCSCTTQR